MTWLLAILVGAVVALVQELRRRKEAARADAAEARAASLTAKTERQDERTAAKDREIARLEKDLEDLPPPAATALAERLLVDPWEGDHPGPPVRK